jgi:hypothetical protein
VFELKRRRKGEANGLEAANERKTDSIQHTTYNNQPNKQRSNYL